MTEATTGVAPYTGRETTDIRPFHVNVPEAELTDLRRRVKATKWPERETVPDDSQGVRLATMQSLAHHWAKPGCTRIHAARKAGESVTP